jgi:hypothetical protein
VNSDTVNEEAYKQTAGKPRYSLLCWNALEGLVAVREYGCKKYPSPASWREVNAQKYIDAAMRHLVELQKGNFTDAEPGLAHADHVMCNMMFLSQIEKENTDADKR